MPTGRFPRLPNRALVRGFSAMRAVRGRTERREPSEEPHSSSVHTYAKATDGRNTVRRSGVTLSSGASLTYAYLSAGGRPDADVSRVTNIRHGATTVCKYRYNGVGSLVGTIYPESDVQWQMFAAGPTYPDLDDFNRVTSSRWTKDLSTDVDFYDLDIAYDRNSNPTRTEDNVHFSGWDVVYTIDDIDRVTSAEEGTWNGSSIPDDTRHQEWTLDHLGNWDVAKWDLNGDGDWSDTDEYQDDRTHNTVNELTGRDTDDNGTDDHTLSYDEVGNLTDDGENYTYEWDAFGRLRKVKNRSTSALVAEYRYNGLGHRIAEHVDTDDDGDVDASDKWYYFAYDEDWRWLATFREDDSDPKEEFVVQHAGLDGAGGSSYINGVVLRDKDANTAWTDASDGTLENRVYYCQNWRGDVSALVTATGKMVEWVKYSAYGVPFGMPSGDADSDGDFDSADQTAIQGLIDTSSYEVRADQDLDGDVDAGDKLGSFRSSGFGALSVEGNRRSNAGVVITHLAGSISEVRRRWYSGLLGRWQTRDPIGYVASGSNLYGKSGSLAHVDPLGLIDTHYMTGRMERCDTPGVWCKWLLAREEPTNPDAGGRYQYGTGIWVNEVVMTAIECDCSGWCSELETKRFWEYDDTDTDEGKGSGHADWWKVDELSYTSTQPVGFAFKVAQMSYFPFGSDGYWKWRLHILGGNCHPGGEPTLGKGKHRTGTFDGYCDAPPPGADTSEVESGWRTCAISWYCCDGHPDSETKPWWKCHPTER